MSLGMLPAPLVDDPIFGMSDKGLFHGFRPSGAASAIGGEKED